jgi:hypothetical protein
MAPVKNSIDVKIARTDGPFEAFAALKFPKLLKSLKLLKLMKLMKSPVGAAEGCDLLILFFKIKRSQPSAAPTWATSCNGGYIG